MGEVGERKSMGDGVRVRVCEFKHGRYGRKKVWE